MQIVGGRGYETAESLKNRGEKPVPVEQMIRDMRINRIFEGSSQIMHLLIAREAVDQHLQIAGAVMFGNLNKQDKAKAALKAGGFYAKWFPGLMTGKGQAPRSFSEFGELAEHLRYVERRCSQAGALHVLRNGPLADQDAEQGPLAGASGRHRRRVIAQRLGGLRIRQIIEFLEHQHRPDQIRWQRRPPGRGREQVRDERIREQLLAVLGQKREHAARRHQLPNQRLRVLTTPDPSV
jgi:Acyl-CoA dehydrogenase, C-terminal domain